MPGDVYRAWVTNRAKLGYEGVGAWLEGAGEGRGAVGASVAAPPAVQRNAVLGAQLTLQHEVAVRLRASRDRRGALELETIEARVAATNGQPTEVRLEPKNAARALIEDFMIAANTTMAAVVAGKGRSSIRRVLRAPERWPRLVELAARYGASLPAKPDGAALASFLARRRVADPAHFPDLSLAVVKLLGPGQYVLERAGGAPSEHFALAVHDYTHATAPNRRLADLVTQRLLKAVVAGAPPPYTDAALGQLAAHCTEREDAARAVEREVRVRVAAAILAPRVGETFAATVTGVTKRGVYVRLAAPPVEGQLMNADRRVDVGDTVRVRLTVADPGSGRVEFDPVGGTRGKQEVGGGGTPDDRRTGGQE